MIKHIILSNFEIYNHALELKQNFNMQDTENQHMYPVKVNFYLQKNINTFYTMAQELEKARVQILEKYKNTNPDIQHEGQIAIDEANIEQVNQELNELFALEQEVTIYTIDLDAFDQIEMTPTEFQAISCMITENFDEKE